MSIKLRSFLKVAAALVLLSIIMLCRDPATAMLAEENSGNDLWWLWLIVCTLMAITGYAVGWCVRNERDG